MSIRGRLPDAAGTAPAPPRDDADDADGPMWTNRLRTLVVREYSPEKFLPDRQPSYAASWIYVFGVACIAALVMLVVSGIALTFAGPA